MIFLFLHPLKAEPQQFCNKSDSVAQLVEHYTFNVVVLGSNPSGITVETKRPQKGSFVV